MNELDGKTLLISGGTGSLGTELIAQIAKFANPRKVIIFSRNEYTQHLTAQKYDFPWLRFMIGDVRDKERLSWCCKGVDLVIHAAAMKRIDTVEYSPVEAIKTNITGSANMVEACLQNDVKRSVLVSTDKAFQPTNLYGATKMTAERLFIAANSYQKTLFRIIRYGNVLASHGSVVELFLKLKAKGIKEFPITDPNMTRFWWSLPQAAQAVLAILTAPANVPPICIPRLGSMKITDLARAIDPECTFKIIGRRPSEKTHEMLCEGYSSETNDSWLTAENIQEILGLDIDKPVESTNLTA